MGPIPFEKLALLKPKKRISAWCFFSADPTPGPPPRAYGRSPRSVAKRSAVLQSYKISKSFRSKKSENGTYPIRKIGLTYV